MWLKFDLTEISTVPQSTLKLPTLTGWGRTSSSDRILGVHFRDNGSLDETTITWNNRPGFNAGFEDTVTNPSNYDIVEFDVTSVV